MGYKHKDKLIYLSMASYVLLYFILIIMFKYNYTARATIHKILITLPSIMAFFVLFDLNIKNRKQKSLFLFALLMISIPKLVRMIIKIYYELILRLESANNISVDVISIISSLVLIIAITRKFRRKHNKYTVSILMIDILTVLFIVVAITWSYIISPYIGNPSIEMSSAKMLFYIVYTTLYLGILSGTIALWKSTDRKDPEKKSFFILIIALIVIYISNVGFFYMSTKGENINTDVRGILWIIYDFLLVIAGIEYYKSQNKPYGLDISFKEKNSELSSILQCISIIFLFLILSFRSDIIIWICFGGSIILTVIRRYVSNLQRNHIMSELEQLNTCLEDKIEERTKEIYEVAFYDHLTGLANRRLFEEMTESIMKECNKEGCSLSIILLDLDRFKVINDTYGHSFGDLLIKEIATTLKELSPKDSIISRQGGDEFAISVKDDKNKSKAKAIAERIQKKLANSINLVNQTVYVTCSIGISSYPRDGKTYDDVIRSSDIAMYYSKKLGRNTYSFYYPDMMRLNSKRLTFERELRNAIINEEFMLYYQPQVDALTREVVGLEALIRWNHPTRGIVSPFEFITVAEETGLIGTIGKWVLESACIQTKIWHDKGHEKLKIGVNISAYQFQQENFVDLVKETLIKTGLNPIRLDLEITESVAMNNEYIVIEKLRALKDLGVQVSMDDFGTGYSSLSYLNKFPIDTLKIPREFIIGIKACNNTINVIEAIIGLAKNLKLNIIAEGVENAMQLKFLIDRECDLIQGYFFSKPLEIENVEEFLSKDLNLITDGS